MRDRLQHEKLTIHNGALVLRLSALLAIALLGAACSDGGAGACEPCVADEKCVSGACEPFRLMEIVGGQTVRTSDVGGDAFIDFVGSRCVTFSTDPVPETVMDSQASCELIEPDLTASSSAPPTDSGVITISAADASLELQTPDDPETCVATGTFFDAALPPGEVVTFEGDGTGEIPAFTTGLAMPDPIGLIAGPIDVDAAYYTVSWTGAAPASIVLGTKSLTLGRHIRCDVNGGDHIDIPGSMIGEALFSPGSLTVLARRSIAETVHDPADEAMRVVVEVYSHEAHEVPYNP